MAPGPDASGAGPASASTAASVVGSALRIWLNHAVPLTLLSAIALSPSIAIALRVQVPADAAAAKSLLALGWTLLAMAWLGQFALVGGASAMISAPRSQLRALGSGFLQLMRAIVPCLMAALAVGLGSLALVVPGPILLVLLSLTGASRERGLPAPLLDSIATVRRRLPAVILAVAAVFAIDAAIGLVAYRVLIASLPAKAPPLQLAATRSFVRAIVLALTVVSPLPATVLALLHARGTPTRAQGEGGPDER
jgi:hypothetical protein